MIGLQRTQRAHFTPLFISLHWLPVAARIKFKTLNLTYNSHRLSTRLLPLTIMNLHSSRRLRSTSERRLVVPSQRDTKSLSRTFSFTVPGWLNDLPTPIQNADSLTILNRLIFKRGVTPASSPNSHIGL